MTDKDFEKLDQTQRRLYRRALDIAPTFVAELKGPEVVYSEELLLLPHFFKLYPWSTRVKIAHMGLLSRCVTAPEEDLREDTPRELPGKFFLCRAPPGPEVPGCGGQSGTG